MADKLGAPFWRGCGFPTKEVGVGFYKHCDEFQDTVDITCKKLTRIEKEVCSEIKSLVNNEFKSQFQEYIPIFANGKQQNKINKEQINSFKTIVRESMLLPYQRNPFGSIPIIDPSESVRPVDAVNVEPVSEDEIDYDNLVDPDDEIDGDNLVELINQPFKSDVEIKKSLRLVLQNHHIANNRLDACIDDILYAIR